MKKPPVRLDIVKYIRKAKGDYETDLMHYRKKEMVTKHCNLVSHETSTDQAGVSIVPLDNLKDDEKVNLNNNSQKREGKSV